MLSTGYGVITSDYLNDILEDEDRPVIRYPPYFTDEDASFEQEEVSLLSFPLGVCDSEPVVSEQSSQLVYITAVPFDTRYKLVVCRTVGDTEEEFECLLEIGAVFSEPF